jgi:hypothetical protein
MGMFDFMKKKGDNKQGVPSAPIQPASATGLDNKAMPSLDMSNINTQPNVNSGTMNTPSEIPDVASSLNSQELNSNNLDMQMQNNSPISDIPPINVEQNMDAPPMAEPDMLNNNNQVNEPSFPSLDNHQMADDNQMINNNVQEKEEIEFPISEDESEKLNEIDLEPAAKYEMPDLNDTNKEIQEPMTQVEPILDNKEIKSIEEPMTPIEPLKLNEINQKENLEINEPLIPLEPSQNMQEENPDSNMNSEFIPNMEDDPNLIQPEIPVQMDQVDNQPMNETFSTDDAFNPDLNPQKQDIINEPVEDVPPELNQGISNAVIKDSLFLNVDVFKDVSDLINNLGSESKIAEEALLRIKDITLNKEKVYDKWRINLEQIEHELIQLDKLLFNV